jgi:hypothetical protein
VTGVALCRSLRRIVAGAAWYKSLRFEKFMDSEI